MTRASKRSKRHHFVPKVLQRAFCASGEQIWYAIRNEKGIFDSVERRNISSCFKRKDYNTVEIGGKLSDVVEKEFFGTIDNYLGESLPSWNESLENGTVPIFSGGPLESLRLVIWHLIKRTPDFVGADEIELGRELIERELQHLESEGAEPESIKAKRDELQDLTIIRQIGRTIRVKAQISRSEKVESEMSSHVVRWGVSKGRHSFILSSLMVYRIGNGQSNGISSRNSEIWVPISPKHCLILLRDPANQIPLVNELDSGKIREINEFGLRKSGEVASHSQALLNSLIAAN